MKSPARLLLALTLAATPAAVRGQAIPLAPEFQVNTYTTSSAGDAAVASAGDGTFIIVWANGAVATRGIYGRRYSNLGAPVGQEFQINTGTAAFTTLPSVAVDGSERQPPYHVRAIGTARARYSISPLTRRWSP
jgi:hypothetical protein